ncbi:MAG: hypothetical protein J6D18_00040, partial [Erysipelotrichaceae bacterium]|nr:hypothetical protein [Erysipelotrichaceae bacterium]
YLQFYIKDGKTYLNNLGVKTQSVVENIGLQSDSRINMMNPFLSFSDDELCALFTSSKKEGNHYTYTLDPAKLATLLDSLGTVTLDNATLESEIEKDVLKNMTLNAKGKQTVNEDSFDFDLTLRFTIEQLNALESVQFPSDLDSYVKE